MSLANSQLKAKSHRDGGIFLRNPVLKENYDR